MKILVPTDLSKNATAALKYAESLSKALKSKLILQNVYAPTVGRYSAISGIIAEESAEAMFENKKQLNSIIKKNLTSSPMLILSKGDPIDEIISSAKEFKAGLIVMGTHGASGLRKTLFGSNTAKVIGKSDVPVLAIPLKYKYKNIKTIVYASDLRDPVKELKKIIPIAKQLNATIQVLNFYFSNDDINTKQKEVEKKIKRLSYKKIKVVEQKTDLTDTIIVRINKYLKKTKPEMLVMFPEERSWCDKIFIGSKTQEFAYHLTLPLLSIKKEK